MACWHDGLDVASVEAVAAAVGKEGVELDAANASGYTVLIRSIIADARPVFDWLLERGAALDSPPLAHTAVRGATLHGRAAMLERLLERGADASIPSAHERTALMGCCTPRDGIPVDDSLRCLRLLLADPRGKATLGAANDDGDTALHLAARGGFQAQVDLLLEHGATLDAPRNHDGKTPRDVAAPGLRLPS
mmetsp:Transcript_13687/g.41386  ORF Transcript_13687/g.41386 Transcript_13687/m.41386 type:complete len:192 (+) Transcript_13687:34-609(+)